MAGHDFVLNSDVKSMGQDWGLNFDGTRNEGAVDSAVREFAHLVGRQISVTYREDHKFTTWMIRK
jgi:hypothetical protein